MNRLPGAWETCSISRINCKAPIRRVNIGKQ